MKVRFRSEYNEIVLAILYQQDFHFGAHTQEKGIVMLQFMTDDQYRDMTLWLGSAMACGLILKGEIER